MSERLDMVTLAVIANRLETIVREMTNTLFRTGRSAVLNTARDFSCSIVTGDDQLLAAAEGLPVHVFGSQLQTAAMSELHADIRPGDAFLDNDAYRGNTHHADHTILVPVFAGEEHLFTAVAKAHQADTGNSAPTTYMPFARDVYEEGSLSFPCVRVQRDGVDVEDVIRMCQLRIRVPDQWYGDYLAMLASARIGERRLGDLVARYGVETIRAFVAQWLDYSEQMAAAAIARLPAGRFTAVGWFDPIPAAPDGLELRVEAAVDPDAGRIVVDLRDNPDCIPAGVNLSQATATNSAIAGVLAALGPDVPVNSGSFRRIEVLLRENCVVGIPRHPTCCSVATTLIADRLVNVTQAAFAGIGDGWGHAHGGHAMGPGFAVVSGDDPRRGGRPFINQLHIGSNGGPAGPRRDGWVTWALPVCAGLLYRDSVEIDEHKYPIHFESVGLVPDSGGAGRTRGAPTAEVVFGPRFAPVSVIYPMDGSVNPARGVVGGDDGNRAHVRKRLADGSEVALPPISREILQVGERIVGRDCGGGYGPPTERDPERVLHDVLEGYVTLEAAHDVYAVAFTGTPDEPGFAVDAAATRALRAAAAR